MMTEKFLMSEPSDEEVKRRFQMIWTATRQKYDRKYGLSKFGETPGYRYLFKLFCYVYSYIHVSFETHSMIITDSRLVVDFLWKL